MERLRLKQEWELGAPLGDPGGFGRVFEAHSDAGTSAAVKLIPKSPGAERELLFDGRGVQNVVPIIDSGEYEDSWAIVMPRAERSLRQHLKQSGGMLPLGDCISVMTDIAVALAALDGNIVHRDLKPENVLLLDGHWCLADFGLARYAEAVTASQTWKLAGTSPYVAPERWRLQRATIASDIYSLGIMAYEMITGDVPFGGPDFQDQHLNTNPPRLSAVPALFGAMVEECLIKAPQARPTPENVVSRLQRIGQSPLVGGLAALAEANRSEAARRAENETRASRDRTEEERRRELFAAAKSRLERISEVFLTALTEVASTGDVRHTGKEGWIFTLGDATLELAAAESITTKMWQAGSTSPFDVVAFSTISLRIPSNRMGYGGRSHALWFCDAKAFEQYRWFETAFMTIFGQGGSLAPYALAPGSAARAAIGPGLHTEQVAWPFLQLDVAELDEFIGRWADWLAKASKGQLGYPGQLPERNPIGSWRK